MQQHGGSHGFMGQQQARPVGVTMQRAVSRANTRVVNQACAHAAVAACFPWFLVKIHEAYECCLISYPIAIRPRQNAEPDRPQSGRDRQGQQPARRQVGSGSNLDTAAWLQWTWEQWAWAQWAGSMGTVGRRACRGRQLRHPHGFRHAYWQLVCALLLVVQALLFK